MSGREANSGWSRPWAAFLALIIILGGVAVSLGFGVRLRGALERNAQARVQTASVALRTTFAAELARYGDTVRGAAARAARNVAVTDAYAQPLLFDVLAPVYAGTAVTGYVVLTVSATEFVSTTLRRAAGTLLDAQLLTRSGTGALVEVATVLQHGGTDTSVRYLQNFEAGRRQWVLRTSAGYATLLPAAGRTDLVVVLAGSVLAVMFGTLMYLQMSAARRADREIALEVAERVGQFEADSDPGRLRWALAVQEALVTDLLAYPIDGAATVHPVDLELRAVVDEVVAAGLHPAGDEPEVAVGDLPPVRADAALLRQVLDTMLADAVRRAPAHTAARIEVSADPQAAPDRVRLLVECAGTVVALTLPAAEQMVSNRS